MMMSTFSFLQDIQIFFIPPLMCALCFENQIVTRYFIHSDVRDAFQNCLQWGSRRAFSAFCKRPILKYREMVGEMLTQRSGRENTSSLLDVPKSCRCDPGHGQVSMITDNQSYHHFLKSSRHCWCKVKAIKILLSKLHVNFSFLLRQISHCATFRRRPLVSTSSAPDLLPWFLFLAEGMRVGRLAAQSDEDENYRSANGGEALSDDDDEVNNWKDRDSGIFAVFHSQVWSLWNIIIHYPNSLLQLWSRRPASEKVDLAAITPLPLPLPKKCIAIGIAIIIL